MFIRNAWYVGAWDHEVGRQSLLRRTLLDEPVVFYRTEGGTPVALEDRCCHRGAPLTHGSVVEAGLQCGYHGLEFDTTGACVAVPGQYHEIDTREDYDLARQDWTLSGGA